MERGTDDGGAAVFRRFQQGVFNTDCVQKGRGAAVIVFNGNLPSQGKKIIVLDITGNFKVFVKHGGCLQKMLIRIRGMLRLTQGTARHSS
jgi:hypothetical protein